MKTSTESYVVRAHLNCPDCGSSDALSEFSDGHTYCFSCKKRTSHNKKENKVKVRVKNKTTIPPIPEEFSALEDRGINAKTAAKFKVTYVDDPEKRYVHYYPYTKDGEYVAAKCRTRNQKGFTWVGHSNSLDLFGQSAFPAGSARAITISEGECDAMAIYQLNGGFPSVSVSSAATAEKEVRNNFEYLNSFDEVVICFDNDKPGQEAAIAVANALPIGKVRIMTPFEYKDANDYLQAGDGKKFKNEWFNAAKYTPASLKFGDQLWDEIINPPEYETTPYPFDGLNSKLYGLRLSEFVVVNAQPKIGKSTLLGQISHHLLKTTDGGIGLMRLEESNRDAALNLMSIEAQKRLHLPDVWEQCTKEELKLYYDETVNSQRVVIWDHFGSNSIEAVLAQIRNMAALGCKYIILDHISIIVSDQSGDERKQLDELATKAKSLCMELNVCLIAVVHQSRDGKIRGTAGIEQLANAVIRLDRDKEHSNEFIRNTMKVVVSENRFCGETGLACYLHFNQQTGLLEEYSEEDYLASAVGHSVNNNEEEDWIQ